MDPDTERYRMLLDAKTKDELNVLAKQLNIRNFRKLSRESLIEAILQTGQENKLSALLIPSWWARYHNHVYGISGVIGLILTILFFVWSKSGSTTSVSNPSKQSSTPSKDERNDKSQNERQATETPSANEIQEARIASETEAFSPISINEYFSRWFDATDLQRDQLEQDMLRKTIIWSGRIRSIESGKDGGVRVIVEPPDGKSGSAFLDFDSSQKTNFLNLKEKQVIRFTCVIRSYVASPFLEKCKLVRVVE